MTVAGQACVAQTDAIAGVAVRIEAGPRESAQARANAATVPLDSPDRHSNFVAPVRPAPELQLQPVPWWANRGRWTFGFQLGYALENAIPRNLSHINLLVAQPQLGLIAWERPDSRLPARRFEILSEGFLGNAVHPGGRVAGHTLIFRLDGKPHGSAMPFFDMGGGILKTMLDTRVPELSGHTQFTPQGGFGLQYFFNPQRAFVVEYRYMHMSNASIRPPNHGFNSSMVTLGFRWFRRPARSAGLGASVRPSRNPFRRLFGAS